MMEIGIIENIPSLDRSSSVLMRLTNRDALDDGMTGTPTALDFAFKAQAKSENRIVDLGLLENQGEDEGEIMLLAMILLQLHGVKLPLTASLDADDDAELAHKKKRQRTSPEQLAILEQIFQTDKMPNQQTRVQLADQLGMSSRRVQIWFQNKRAKVKRGGSKHENDSLSPQLGSPSGSPPSPQESAAKDSSSAPVPEFLSSASSPSSSAPSPLSPGGKQSAPSAATALQETPVTAPVSSQSQPNTAPPTTFNTTQLQFSLSAFDSILSNEYASLRLQALLKN